MEASTDHGPDPGQSPSLVSPPMRRRPPRQFFFQESELRVGQFRTPGRSPEGQALRAGLTPRVSPAFHRPLGDPQFVRDLRVLFTPGEPFRSFQSDLFPGLPPFGTQATPLRISHEQGVPQGSPPVTTDFTSRVSVMRSGFDGAGMLDTCWSRTLGWLRVTQLSA